PPLQDLVEGAEGETDADAQEAEERTRLQSAGAPEELAHEHRRYEPLRQVADAVEMIARQVEGVAQPVEQGHLRVRVLGAAGDDHEMDRREDVHETREGVAPPGRDEQGDADET